MKRVLFLFNHEAPHQVAHLAGTAAAFAREYPQHTTVVAHGGQHIRKSVEEHIPSDVAHLIEWRQLNVPRLAGAAAGVLDKLLPASRLLRLRANTALFASADVVVSTERTCLRIKRHMPTGTMPRFVRMPHGAGDRNVTYHPDYRRFDLVLASGEKTFAELVKRGVDPARVRIVGYPKLDRIDLSAQPKPFDNDRPIFVYNPHFDPYLSSWYDHGPELLRWFASEAGKRFNLIFAPHVMLFRKKLHISPEYKVARVRPEVPAEALRAGNIMVDVDGPRLFDMSHLLAADAYIGDVSSQLYEFLVRPRPVFLLGRDEAARRDSGSRLFRQAGPLFSRVGDLAGALPDWKKIGCDHRDAQQAMFDHTFSRENRPAASRAAAAVAELALH